MRGAGHEKEARAACMDRCARSPNCARLKKFTEIERRPVISLIGILRLVRIGNDRLVADAVLRNQSPKGLISSNREFIAKRGEKQGLPIAIGILM